MSCCIGECRSAQCCYFYAIILGVVILSHIFLNATLLSVANLSVVMLIFVKLSVTILSVILISVSAQKFHPKFEFVKSSEKKFFFSRKNSKLLKC